MIKAVPYTNLDLEKQVLTMALERVSSAEAIALQQLEKWFYLIIDTYQDFSDADRQVLKKAIAKIGFYPSNHQHSYWINKILKEQPMFSQLCFLHLTDSTKFQKAVGDNLHHKFSYTSYVKRLFSVDFSMASSNEFYGFQKDGFFYGNLDRWKDKPINFIRWRHLTDIEKDGEATILHTKKNPIIIHIDKHYSSECRIFSNHKEFKHSLAIDYWDFKKLIEFKDILCGDTEQEIKFKFDKREILNRYLASVLNENSKDD